jgi:NAD(P)H-dependent flavin oxidoreductase YrpB (nitropropane dioxygenase family)
MRRGSLLETSVTKGLGIRYPILSAGMARVSQAPLVAAVSEAGGMGCLGGVSYMPDELRREIQAIRALTDAPFAVDLVVPEILLAEDDAAGWQPVREVWEHLLPEQRAKLKGVEPLLTPGVVQEQVEIILEERPAALALTFNTPRAIVDACHERGMQVIALTGSVGRSVAAAEAGVDYIVAQGAEGGGHTGYVGTLALIPAVVDAVSVPVIAAGGIVDGRGLAAALCLGAGGVWCGTRFIASAESYGHERYKQRVLEAAAKDTTLTKAYTGKNLRTLRNVWTTEWEGRTQDLVGFPAQYAIAAEYVETGYQDGDVDHGLMPVGQGVGLVKEILPAGEIVREIAEDASAVLGILSAHAHS